MPFLKTKLAKGVFPTLMLLSSCVCLMSQASADIAKDKGKSLFATECARCHGSQAEGNPEEYDQPLVGNLSVGQLRGVIKETMPADDPGKLTPDQASAIAAYLHREFYSPAAQQRNRPVRKQLARLTAVQHRLVLSDLVNRFLHEQQPDSQAVGKQGLRGSYFNHKEPGWQRQAALTRLDPQIDFDFASGVPDQSIKQASRYAIRWEGSLVAPETGHYTFTIQTNLAARLRLNQPSEVESYLVDAWIVSKSQTEHTGKCYLVGGRRYPLRLEFSKATLGVDEQIKKREQRRGNQTNDDPAFIRLAWKRPTSQASAPIPARFLSPRKSVVRYVCETPFPPDDRSYGWVRGVTVSKAWSEATTAAAIDAANYLAEHVEQIVDVSEAATVDVDSLRAACEAFLARSFRSQAELTTNAAYLNPIFDALNQDQKRSVELTTAQEIVRRVALVTLTSPRFLFREVGDSAPQHRIASRLSLGLWDSLPDDKLREAAEQGQLASHQEVRRMAQRMLSDDRAKAKLNRFLMSWLHLDGALDLNKDAELYPDFNRKLQDDLRASLEVFLEQIVWSEASDFRQLLLDEHLPATARMRQFYQASLSTSDTDRSSQSPAPGEGFASTRFDAGKRAGVLSHPYVMAHFAHLNETSPIHRGVFLARGVLGISLKPPPNAFAPLSPDLHPQLTTRERVTLQTRDASCMTCHRVINPLGFTLEKFDAVGRMREEERGKPIDNLGEYQPRTGGPVRLHGARELAEFLVESPDCHQAFIEQMFHHLIQQPMQAYDSDLMQQLYRSFVESEYNVRELAVSIVTAAAIDQQPKSRLAASAN